MKDLKTFSEACRKFGGIAPKNAYPADKAGNKMVLLVSGSFTTKKTAENAELFAKLLLKNDLTPVFLAPINGRKNKQTFYIKNFPVFTVSKNKIQKLILEQAALFRMTVICSAYDASLVNALNGEMIPVLWLISELDDNSIWDLLKDILIFKCRNISIASMEADEKKELLKHRPYFHVSDISEYFSARPDQESFFSRLVEDTEKTTHRAVSRAAIKMEKTVFQFLERNRSLLSKSSLLLSFWNRIRGIQSETQFNELDRLQQKPGRKICSKVISLFHLDLIKQRGMTFPKALKFSIVVPLYNTPFEFLWEMIKSVRKQTYSDWELCLADGSDAEHGYVKTACRILSALDHRIRYRKLNENLGISGNTNAALEMAEGDYIALLDHDDVLHSAALYEVAQAIFSQGADMIYTDETSFHEKPQNAFNPHYKPDYAPDTLRSNNYICHFTVFKTTLLDSVGLFRPEYDGSQDYDMVLRLTEQAKQIVHIPEILYYWRSHPGSVAFDIAAKPYAIDAARRALSEHLSRIGLKGEVLTLDSAGTYRVRYELTGMPKISILIPTRDHVGDLSNCINSIIEKTTYPDWEIIIINNNSTLPETFTFYKEITKDERIRVVSWNREFNYSQINNYGAGFAVGDYLILLNNDTQIITPDWIQEMLMFAQRKDVGAVGAKLYFPDDTIQHAGVCLGLGGVAAHILRNADRNSCGYMRRLTFVQNFSAVTAACMMISKKVWDQVGGLDPEYAVAFNDVDLCMQIRKAGYLIVWTPFAELYHFESKSRGKEDTRRKQKRFIQEVNTFRKRWIKELMSGDPYYNPHFSLDDENYSIVSPDIARARIAERNKGIQS